MTGALNAPPEFVPILPGQHADPGAPLVVGEAQRLVGITKSSYADEPENEGSRTQSASMESPCMAALRNAMQEHRRDLEKLYTAWQAGLERVHHDNGQQLETLLQQVCREPASKPERRRASEHELADHPHCPCSVDPDLSDGPGVGTRCNGEVPCCRTRRANGVQRPSPVEVPVARLSHLEAPRPDEARPVQLLPTPTRGRPRAPLLMTCATTANLDRTPRDSLGRQSRGSSNGHSGNGGSTRPRLGNDGRKYCAQNLDFQTLHDRAMMKKQSRTSDVVETDEQDVAESPRWASRIVRSAWFRILVFAFIGMNSLTVGLQSEIMLKRASLNASAEEMNAHMEHFLVFDWIFTVFFLMELMLRILADGPSKFCHPQDQKDRNWNVFDTALVFLSVFHLVLQGTIPPAGRIFQIIRFSRLTRLLRVIRVMRFIPPTIKVMVHSIMSSFSALLWVFMILLLIMYAFALIFMHGVTAHFEEENGRDPILDAMLMEHYGTIFDGIISLFGSISGGLNWRELLRPLLEVGGMYGCFFVFYIYFMIFGALNVVTSVFVDSVYKLSLKSRDIAVQQERQMTSIQIARIENFFREADVDASGQLSFEEFEDSLMNEECAAHFSSLGLDISQATALFALLDKDNSNEIGIDEFVEGCMKLKGEAKSLDVNMLLFEQRKMMYNWGMFMEYLDQELNALRLRTLSRSASPVTSLERRNGFADFSGPLD